MSGIEVRASDWRGRISRYAPLILWIGVIFFASSTSGSMSNTSTFIRPILEFLFPNSPEATLLVYHGYLRKLAHFGEYAVLAFFASRTFWNSSLGLFRNHWRLCALMVVTAVASIDEFSQSFNPARTGSIYDIMIDISAGISMIIVIVLVKARRSKVKTVKYV